uniref:Phosphonoacetaldehyde hydrolase n=1 Tax=Alexandrium catenella TaxID=2925 RepID=A0A7S1WT36_ALECA
MAGTTVDDLVDGVPLVIAAFRAAFKVHDGSAVDSDQANAVRGYEKKEAIRRLLCASRGIELGAVDLGEVETLFGIFKVELDKLTASMNTEIAGTTAVFEQLRARGMKVFVGSGFPDHVVQGIVANMGWTVDGALSSEALGAGRPDPVMVYKAMELSGIPREEGRRVVKVGDTVVDVEEGRNGGAYTVSVLTGTQSREKLEAAKPDMVIGSVAELPALLGCPQSSI